MRLLSCWGKIMSRSLPRFLLASAFTLALSAPVMAGNFTVLHTFKGGRDGTQPLSALTLDAEGNIYGTTFHGGTGKCNNVGCGTVFRIAPDGTKTVLYNFRGGKADGAWPLAGVIFGADGALYGTASHGGGGQSDDCEGNGCGAVYRLTTDGQESILHFFSGDTDGHIPRSRLTMNRKGMFTGQRKRAGAVAPAPCSHCRQKAKRKFSIVSRTMAGMGYFHRPMSCWTVPAISTARHFSAATPVWEQFSKSTRTVWRQCFTRLSFRRRLSLFRPDDQG
jgi:uncharacterized repeat protein (TIGR03803 family)